MKEILQYTPGNGILHRLTPFTKFAFLTVVVLASILTTDVVVLAAIVAGLAALTVASGLYREMGAQVPLFVVMSTGLILLTVLTMQGGGVLFPLIPAGVPVLGGALPVTTEGLLFGVILSLRFIALIIAFQLVVITTQPRELTYGLRRIHLPVDYTLIFLIALRFIPTLQLEAKRIQEAQLARGYNPGTGLSGKVRSLIPIMVPLVSNALARATVLGLTIDMRGYRNSTLTAIRSHPATAKDWIFLGVLAVCIAAYLLVSF